MLEEKVEKAEIAGKFDVQVTTPFTIKGDYEISMMNIQEPHITETNSITLSKFELFSLISSCCFCYKHKTPGPQK
jgi:hypothetical protein